MAKIGRNDPCPCGSERKYKRCHGKKLPYEAHLKSIDGKQISPRELIFPICQWTDGTAREFQVVGTGFFIREDGIFLTARHVVADRVQKHGLFQYDDPEYALVPDLFAIMFSELQFFARPLDERNVKFYKVGHNTADIAIGRLHTFRHKVQHNVLLTNKQLPLDVRPLKVGETVGSFGYPSDKAFTKITDGKLVGVSSDQWQFGLVEAFVANSHAGPRYRTSVSIPHGASGGPVTNEMGFVAGVNSSGYSGDNTITFVARVEDALDLELDNVVWSDDDPNPQSVSLRELAQGGYPKVVGL